jgi:hypothetical protein
MLFLFFTNIDICEMRKKVKNFAKKWMRFGEGFIF